MQFRKPMVFLAALGLCMFPVQTHAAQQNPPSATPAGKTPGASQTTVTVPSPDVPKRADTPAASKNTRHEAGRKER